MSRYKTTIFGVLIIGLLLSADTGFAKTINAASCSQANVSSAIGSATAGDTVFVPAGACSWGSSINLSKAITIQGTGEATTITATGDSLFKIEGNGSGNYRISSMNFLGRSSSGSDIAIGGVWDSIRIDNIKWNTQSTRAIIAGYYHVWDILISGISVPHQKILIDNINYSPASAGGGEPFLLLYGRNHLAWQEEDGFGTDNFVFIEDSRFNFPTIDGYVIDTEFAARYVFRYNTVTNGSITMHDLGSTPNSRGNRAVEVYENTFNCTASACGDGAAIALYNTRGGTGIFFNNTISGYSLPTWNMLFRVAYNNSFIGGGYCKDTGSRKVCQDMAKHCSGGTRDKRPCYDNSDCPGATCGGYSCSSNSDCRDSAGNIGLCLQLDGDSDSGYPCRDQSGRGKDNPMTGAQESSPIYWYNNSVNGTPNAPMSVGGQYSAYIQSNRDYCNQSPSTACGSKGAWLYTPYTYPHPWRSGDFSTQPPPQIYPPKSLRLLK